MRLALPAALVAALVAIPFVPRGEAAPAVPAPTAPRALETYGVDEGHSIAIFRVKHLGTAWFYGTLDAIGGKVEFDPEAPENSSVRIVVRTDSVDSNNAERDELLRGPGWFRAAEHPEMVFESTAVKALEGGDLEVTGDFTLAGTTKEITFVAEEAGAGPSPFGDYRRGYETSFTIDRRDYEVAMDMSEALLGHEVRMTISLELVRR